MEINAFTSSGHPAYREYSTLGAIAAEITKLQSSELIEIDQVLDAMGRPVTIKKIRMAIAKISKQNFKKYKTAVKDGRLTIRAL